MSNKQRTKGNLKPASSSRAAAKLTGIDTGQLISFEQLATEGSPSYPSNGASTSETYEEQLSNLNGETRTIFRKLVKKDNATKDKALRELRDFVNCDATPPDQLLFALGCWLRPYRKLTVEESNYRIRSAAHEVQTSFAVRLKEKLRKCLADIIPLWLFGQHDSYNEVSKTAIKGFQEVFSDDKRNLVVCKFGNETVKMMLDLIRDIPLESADETKENRECRIQSTALLTLRTVLSESFSSDVSTATTLHTSFSDIFADSQFWKLSKSKYGPVRSAFFLLLSTAVVEPVSRTWLDVGKLAPLLLNALDDVETAAAVWHCWQTAITHYSQALLSKLSVSKALAPKFISIMRSNKVALSYAAPTFPPTLVAILDSPSPPADINRKWMESLKQGTLRALSGFDDDSKKAAVEAFCGCFQTVLDQKRMEGGTIECVDEFILDSLLPVTVAWVKRLRWKSTTCENDALSKLTEKVAVVVETSPESKFAECLNRQLALLLEAEKHQNKMAELLLSVTELLIKETERKRFLLPYLRDIVAVLTVDSIRRHHDIDTYTILQKLTTAVVVETSPESKFAECLNRQLALLLEAEKHQNKMAELLLSVTELLIKETERKRFLLPYLRDIVAVLTVDSIRRHHDIDTYTILQKLTTAAIGYRLIDDEMTIFLKTSLWTIVRNLQSDDEKLDSKTVAALQTLLRLSLADGTACNVIDVLVNESVVSERALLRSLPSEADEMFNVVLGSPQFERLWLRCLRVLFDCAHDDVNNCEIADLLRRILDNKQTRTSSIVDSTLTELSVLLDISKSTADCASFVVIANLALQLTLSLQADDSSIRKVAVQLWSLVIGNTSMDEHLVGTLRTVRTTVLTMVQSLSHNVANELHINVRKVLFDDEILFKPRIDWLVECVMSLNDTSGIKSVHDFSSVVSVDTEFLTTCVTLASVHGRIPLTPLLQPYYMDNVPVPRSVFCNLIHYYNRTVFQASLALLSDDMTNEEVIECGIACHFISTCLSLLRRTTVESEHLLLELQDSLAQHGDGCSDDAVVTKCMDYLAKESCAESYPSWIYYVLAIESLRTDPKSNPVAAVKTFSEFDLLVTVVSMPEQPRCLHETLGTLSDCSEKDLVTCWTRRFALCFCPELLDEWMLQGPSDHLAFCRGENESIPFDDMALSINLARFLRFLLFQQQPLTSEQSDFVCCSLVSFLQSLDSLSSCRSYPLFAGEVMRLFSECVDWNKPSEASGDESNKTAQEWNEFFLPSCAKVIVPLFLTFAEEIKAGNANELPVAYHLLIDRLSEAASFITAAYVQTVQLPIVLDPELDSLGYSADLQSILAAVAPLLCHRFRSIQIVCWKWLSELVSNFANAECDYYASLPLSGDDSGAEGGNGQIESEVADTRKPPPPLLRLIVDCYPRLESADKIQRLPSLYENIEQSPQLGANLLAYLLTWDLILRFMAEIPLDKRPLYTSHINSSKLLDNLLITLFCLMPMEPGSAQISTLPTELNSNESQETAKMIFLNEPCLSVRGIRRFSEIEHLCCHMYFLGLLKFPAMIRQWYRQQDKVLTETVSRFTTKHVSELLVSYELRKLSTDAAKSQLGDVAVVVRPSVGEVTAVYQLEDTSVELRVVLPSDYPLEMARVSAERMGVSKKLERNWMLQLTAFLSYQNGSLMDGLVMWKRNIDRHLEGVEGCLICFMTIHSSTYQLPRVTCRQCQKKFHSACLYKWFHSSNKTSCPLCRNLF